MAAVVIVVVIVVAAIGVGVYYASTPNKSNATTTASNSTTSTKQQTSISQTPTSSASPSTSTSPPVTTSSTQEGKTSAASSTSSAKVMTTTSVAASSSSSVSAVATTAATSSTVSCSSGTSTGASGQPQPVNFAPLFSSFSAMSMTETINSNGTTESIASSYTVQSHTGSGSSATYVVMVSQTTGGNTVSGTATYQGDGTVQSITFQGQTLPGTVGSSLFNAWMTSFVLELNVQNTYQTYLSFANIAKVNQTSISIGPSSTTVTNYKANNTPFTTTSCGYTFTINSLAIQLGQVQGSSYGTLVTYEAFNGVSGGAPLNYALQITSITKA